MKWMSFGDAGFFFAIVDANDRWHKERVALLAELKKGGWQLVTTLLVVAETHALLLRRFGSHAAMLWLKHALPYLTIVPVEPTDLDKALSILERYADKDFSLTDAISFAVMERLGISRAMLTKPTEGGYFQSASADFVSIAQHFNAGRRVWEGSGCIG
ncbi:MAG: hypothetical protein SLRJCFUN_000112 [Candidatus Fervidibacter sp.]|jgi:hypothetical protein